MIQKHVTLNHYATALCIALLTGWQIFAAESSTSTPEEEIKLSVAERGELAALRKQATKGGNSSGTPILSPDTLKYIHDYVKQQNIVHPRYVYGGLGLVGVAATVWLFKQSAFPFGTGLAMGYLTYFGASPLYASLHKKMPTYFPKAKGVNATPSLVENCTRGAIIGSCLAYGSTIGASCGNYSQAAWLFATIGTLSGYCYHLVLDKDSHVSSTLARQASLRILPDFESTAEPCTQPVEPVPYKNIARDVWKGLYANLYDTKGANAQRTASSVATMAFWIYGVGRIVSRAR